MKKHLATSFSKVLLNIILFMLGMSVVAFITIILSFGIDINSFVYLILCLIYFLVVYNLRKIVYSSNSTPFSFDNVRRFKQIGYYMILMAVIDGIVNWKRESNFNFIGTQSGSLKGSFIMYVILACMALVLSEIFEKAVEIKKENDLTV
ncbi:DUF2975 domain-containing protein [Clostridium beijerinckii]|uniref:Uncharacterized protein n=1 Tax=Clostridium beijerinckii TaxID=1520 RepID=A0A1B9BFR8_CLOBE|nr:DUF2975 domain-containing protein [Clostridium beijerinckii]NRY59401.1 hypothetical protein [Clostridium beijerinckii]OCA96557.1 hypothetical protein BGS1_06875 [Clostridium beijerinckii]OOM58714.1 hypothetical protein CLBCK_38470 [Clostridium beijerinckii]